MRPLHLSSCCRKFLRFCQGDAPERLQAEDAAGEGEADGAPGASGKLAMKDVPKGIQKKVIRLLNSRSISSNR